MSETAPSRMPAATTILLRFAVQGVVLGALGAMLVSAVLAFPIFTIVGLVGLVGALLGGPAGFAAGLGVIVASRLSARAVALGTGGAIGAAVVMVPVVVYLRGFASPPLGVTVIGVAVVGAAIASPLTVRALRRISGADDRTGSWLLVAALVSGGVATLVAVALAISTFNVSEACRGLGEGEAHEALFPPQVTCLDGGQPVELISRGWYALIAAACAVAVVLTVIGMLRIIRRGAKDAVSVAAVGGLGAFVLAIGIVIGMGMVQPPLAVAEPRPPVVATPRPDPDPVEVEPIPLDPAAGLPDTPELSTAFTKDALMTAMQQLADDSFATAGPINDPAIPAGTQPYAVQSEPCGTTGVRVTLDAWFATGANAAGIARIKPYWESLGYTALSEPGHVAAAGREPLPAQSLDLLQTWDDDDLRLRLTSVCVADGPTG